MMSHTEDGLQQQSLSYGCKEFGLTISLKKLNSFHLRCLLRILHIQRQDKVPNTEVLERTGMRNMSAVLSEKLLRWLGHVRRMGPGRIPRDLLYGELAKGSCQERHEIVQYRHMGEL
ncbi:putative transposon-derived [Labeo rohita]|uniref:Putative transposon-derived n=1 Tax=Labeo rohita TaxID=84645 RepID=A0A498LFP0_LABRO|nr:putative transposon-derived [Labeo rohita]RXN06971.1 putative transposon-derived [Labeo rohita]